MKMKRCVQQVLEEAVERQELAGVSVLVRCEGEELFFARAGYADRESGKSVRRDSIFRLYSQSKPITAVAAMVLVERGVLDLMEGVDVYLPGFRGCCVVDGEGVRPALRAPTIMDLLGMTSGLCYPAEDAPGRAATPLFEEQQRLIDEGGAMDTLTFCNRMGALPLAFDPGTHFRYGTSADVLGAVIEAASGKRFGDFLRDELFDPLGMEDTGFWVPPEKQERLVTCYRRAEDGTLAPWTSQHLAVGRYDRRPAFESGGAGLVSTLDDYAAFAQMLLNGGEYHGERILSPTSIDFLTRPQLMDTPAKDMWESLNGFGYGKLMRICTDPGRYYGFARQGEYGWDGWLGTYFANFPHQNLTLLLMTNKTDTGTSPTTRRVRNVVLAHMK